MTFLETVENEKEKFLKEEGRKHNKKIILETEELKKYWNSLNSEEKKEYENNDAWYSFLLNFVEDKLDITFEEYEPTLEDYLKI